MDEMQNSNELDNIVTLTDENGVDTDFEFLDLVAWQGKEYVILLPVAEAEQGLVVIFRVEGEGDNETYVGLDNEEEAEAVFNAFKKQAQDDFNFLN